MEVDLLQQVGLTTDSLLLTEYPLMCSYVNPLLKNKNCTVQRINRFVEKLNLG